MIRAAGGVLWRRPRRELEIALVHRRPDDRWLLPSGELRGDEHPMLLASRKVREQTGVLPVLGPRLPTRPYQTPDGPITVRYWAMRGDDDSFTVADEMDRCVWLPVPEARTRFTYPDDTHLLEPLAEAAKVDTVVLLVRHASAGDPAQWTGHDTLRPLDARGEDQAEALRRILPLFAPSRLLSVDNRRCRDTLTPLAADLNLPVGLEQTVEERQYAEQPARGQQRIRELAGRRDVTVLCSQGKVIPDLVAALAEQDGLRLPDVRAKKGSIWALFFCAGVLAAADYYPDLASPHG